MIRDLFVQSDLLRRVGWTTIGYVGTQVVRFGTSVILTRILAPELFGVMILLMSLRVGLELFTDLGIGQNVVASKNADDPDFFNTAWTLQIIRGVLLAALSLALVPVFTSFYDQQELNSLLPYLSLFFIMVGFQSIGHPLSLKHLRNDRMTAYEITTATGGSAIIILCSILSPTIMGLLAGNLLATAFSVLCSYPMLMKVGHRLMLKRQFVMEIVTFGKWIFLMSVTYFMATNFDRLILAKYVTFAALGLYGLAKSLGDVLAQLSTRLGAMVIFPSVASVDLPAAELRAKLARRRWQFLLFSAASASGLIAASDLIIAVLYDDRYQGAALALPWVALATWVSILCTLNENVLLGLRKPAYLASANAAKLGGLLAFLPLGISYLGVVGAAIATMLAEIFRYTVSSYGNQRLKVGFIGQDLAATTLMLISVILIRSLAHLLGITGSLEATFSLDGQLR